MRITIDVKKAEQSFDFDTQSQQNYLVVEFAGQEIRIPCDEEQLAAAISECVGHAPTLPAPVAERVPVAPTTAREFSFEPDGTDLDDAEGRPVASPSMFVVPEPKPVPVPSPAPAAPQLRPVARKPTTKQADDAGIAQG